jgi:hypothetical protein
LLGYLSGRLDPSVGARKAHLSGAVLSDSRPNAPPENIFWSANLSEAGHFIYGYDSTWLPAALLRPEQRARLSDALFEAGRIWPIELHFGHRGSDCGGGADGDQSRDVPASAKFAELKCRILSASGFGSE